LVTVSIAHHSGHGPDLTIDAATCSHDHRVVLVDRALRDTPL
jgi:hypothetical protein